MTNPYLELVARLETRGGEATIKGPKGEDSNNLFNIKETRAGKVGYSARDKAEGSNDAYRVYASRDESQADMESMLARRYPEAFDAMQKPWSPESVQEFAAGLKKRGYATDPDYVAKLVKLSNQVDGSTYSGRTSATKMTALNSAVTEVINSYVVRPADERLVNARREAANFNQRIIAESQPTFVERFGATMSGNTDAQIFDGVKDMLFGPKYPKEKGFVPDVSLLPQGADSKLVNDFKLAGSKAEADAVLEDFHDEQARSQAIMSGGTGSGIALSFLAEVPTLSNLLPSVAAAKLAKAAGYANSLQLMAEGRKGAMVGAAIAENVVSGTAVEAIRQGVTGDYSLSDLGIAAAADLTFGLAQAGIGMRSAGKTLHAQAVQGQVEEYAGRIEKARVALGEAATPDELVKYADNLKTQEIADIARAADTHELPRERRLLDTTAMRRTLTRGEATVIEDRILANIEGAGQYPTVNPSEDVGRLQREVPTTEGFKEFFGNSKAVDAEGKPVIVYHMTKAENLTEFDKTKLGTNTNVASAKEGFFFAGDPNTVNVYANTAAATGESPNVIPVYLSLQNPMEFDMGGSLYRKRSYASLLREAKNKGHDGAIIRNTFDGGNKDDIYVAFEPNQIKSALSNSGAYSKDTANIQMSAPGVTGKAVTAQDLFPPRAKFEASGSLDRWETRFNAGGDFADEIAAYTGGKYKTIEDIKALPAGVHASGAMTAETKQTVAAMQALAKRFMPDTALTVHFDRIPHGEGFAHAKVGQVSKTAAMVMIDPTLAPSQMVRAAVHEMGHVVFNRGVEAASKEELAGIKRAFNAFRTEANSASPDGNKARAMRFSITNVDQQATREASDKLVSNYQFNFDEYAAEQFVKYTEKNMEALGLAAKTVKMLKEAIDRVLRLFKAAKREHIDVDQDFESFFNSLLDGQAKTADGGEVLASSPLAQMATPSTPAQAASSVSAIQADPDMVRFGLSTLPVATDLDRANIKQMLDLHRKAEAWAVKNPMDGAYMARVQNLADNNVFNVASIGLLMLKSESPLVRMIASELVEDASGVLKGRRDTAAITKYITERAIMGNAINDVQGAYNFWKKGKQDAGLWDDMIGGKNWDLFNREVASEIEARRIAKGPVTTDANVKAAADSLEAAYTRAANLQRKAKVLGWASFPESSVGYMPHKMSPKAVMAMTNDQQQVLHSALTDQFITIEGWDASFADELASKYMKRVRDRAAGDYGTVIGGNSQGAADIVHDALTSMNLSAQEIKAHMEKYTKGAANFTKSRIELDLNRVYDTPTGPFKLLDIFETNQIELLRSQAGRASGDIALAKHGVYGRPGLQLLRDAMRYGEDGKKAGIKDFESFDQMAAEFMNDPFGTHGGKFMERAMAANTLVRLGGIVFNQMAETINGIFHVGAMRTASSVASIPRLHAEIKDLAAGKHVDNPIIGSIELVGGAEFGTDAYKFVMPFDSPDHAYPTYGKDTLTVTDRLLRGGNHLQAKLSGWRYIHSAQQRGMAEQIVHKMMRYVRDGNEDKALRDFGVTKEVQAYLKENLSKIATFDGDRLVRFEADKLPDGELRDQVIQSVWRGTQQIIQGTFIGEKGKWAHDGLLKALTQFRGFGLTSMEKQWGRQRNMHGSYAAFGMAIGAMSLAAPIYMARVYASSIGRPDQQEYLDKQLTPQNVARATLNYIAMSGMAGDFVDLTTAVMPDAVKEATGFNPMGSTGKEADMVGNYILPSASLANDAFKWLQSPFDLQDAMKIVPGSRLPFMVPLMNVAKEE